MATQINYLHMNYIGHGWNECTSLNFILGHVLNWFCNLNVYLRWRRYLLKVHYRGSFSGCQESVEKKWWNGMFEWIQVIKSHSISNWKLVVGMYHMPLQPSCADLTQNTSTVWQASIVTALGQRFPPTGQENSYTVRNGGPLRPVDGNLSHFVQKRKMADSVLTKGFLQGAHGLAHKYFTSKMTLIL